MEPAVVVTFVVIIAIVIIIIKAFVHIPYVHVLRSS
jgi:hypothetical protein